MASPSPKTKVDAKKYAALKKHIDGGRKWTPKVGDYVYTDTRMSTSHGWDDVVGGLSTVTRVYTGMSGGDPKCVFIEIAEHERGSNWTQFIQPEQKRLKKEFGKSFAYPDPDEVSSDW